MSLTIASIETDIGTALHTVAADAIKIANAIHTVVADITKSAPLIEAAVTAINPSAGLAATAIVNVINIVDTAVQTGISDATGGVTLTLPADLVALYKSAKSAVVTFEQTL